MKIRLRVCHVALGLGVIGLSACAPEDNKLVSGYQKYWADRAQQKVELSVDEFRGDVLDYTVYGVQRLLEAKHLFEIALGAPVQEQRCQKLDRIVEVPQQKLLHFEIVSDKCRGHGVNARVDINAIEAFEVKFQYLPGAENGPVINELEYKSLNYDVDISRPAKSARVTGNAFFSEKRTLSIMRYRGSEHKSETSDWYSFTYKVEIPKIEQTLYENDYKMNEYEGVQSVFIHGKFEVLKGESVVNSVAALKSIIKREGMRNIAKRETPRGRHNKIFGKFSKVTAVQEPYKNPETKQLEPLHFQTDCSAAQGRLYTSFNTGGSRDNYRGMIGVQGREWQVGVDGKVVPFDLCVKSGEIAQNWIPYDLVFFK